MAAVAIFGVLAGVGVWQHRKSKEEVRSPSGYVAAAALAPPVEAVAVKTLPSASDEEVKAVAKPALPAPSEKRVPARAEPPARTTTRNVSASSSAGVDAGHPSKVAAPLPSSSPTASPIELGY